jgi:RimJ/RimL family protein N-acetyltransferase
MPEQDKAPLKDGRVAIIRLARPGDAESEVELESAVGGEGLYIDEDKSERSVEEMRDDLAEAETRSKLRLVAEVDGRFAGSIGLARGHYAKNSHTGSLGIYIHQEFRSLGIGEALMRGGIDWARKVGLRKLTLGVFATNLRAIGLYRKVGFAEEARLKGHVMIRGEPVDRVFMTLWL